MLYPIYITKVMDGHKNNITMAINNRATRFNRTMMFGTMVLGLLVIGICMGFMYYSFDVQKQQKEAEALGDSLILNIEDSRLLD